jgi:hypothetical protein
MTPTLSRQFFETFPPEVARGILEGDRLRVHAAKVSVVRDKTGAAFAIDTLPRDGRPAEWEKTTQRICRILKGEVDRLPAETKRALAAVAHILPAGEPILLFQVETWLSMKDDGGSWWEVPAYLSLVAISLSDVVRASERAKKKILKEVRKI